MEDTLQIKIMDREVSFGFLGRSFRLQAVDQIRAKRKAAFKEAIADLPSNPVSVASAVSAAIDAHMTSVIVDDQDVNSWLATPEGYFYSFSCSALKANPDLSKERISELHDRLSTDEFATLRRYWGRSIDGNRYDDIEESVKKYFRKAAIEFYGADGNAIDLFGEWIKNGRPGKAVEEVSEPTVETVPELTPEPKAPDELVTEKPSDG